MKKKIPKVKPQTIEVKEADGKVKKIGKYYSDKKVFETTRERSIHLMRKWNAWGLDSKVVEFLAKEGATIHLKDKETKWEYQTDAKNFILYGKVEEYHQHRPQLFLNLDHWEIIKAKNRSLVIECKETDCKHNITKTCFKGVITISKTGECEGYEDRQDD